MQLGAQTATSSRSALEGDEGDAVRMTVAEAEKHQSDVDEFVALHANDAIIVNLAGRRVFGREAIHQAMQQGLESEMAKVFTRSDVEDVRLVTPDVALVSCTKHVVDERDDPVDDGALAALPSTGSLTYVMVKHGATWQIALAQTTPITI